MAAFSELLAAQGNTTLREKVRIACTIAAEAVRKEDPATLNHDKRIAWAKAVFDNPEAAGNSMIWAVLAQNATLPIAAIINASDTDVLTAVTAAVPVFAT